MKIMTIWLEVTMTRHEDLTVLWGGSIRKGEKASVYFLRYSKSCIVDDQVLGLSHTGFK